MEQGLSQVELSQKLGVNEMTIMNWEIRGVVPQNKSLRKKLKEAVSGVGKWFKD